MTRPRPLRVAMMVPAFPQASETFIVNKFLGLLSRGVDAHVVCGASSAREWERSDALRDHPEGAKLRNRVHIAPPAHSKARAVSALPGVLRGAMMANASGTRRYLSDGRAQFGNDVWRRFYLDAILLRLRPDIVHWEFGTLAVGRLETCDLLGCRHVVSFRGFDLNFAGLDKPDYYADVWQHADALHLLGEDLWRRAQERGCPIGKAHALIAPAVDATVFDPGVPDSQARHEEIAGTESRPLRILSVGRLEWKKGYEHAMLSMRHLRESGVHFRYRVLGEGKHREAVAFARHELGLKNEVELLGAQPREQVLAELRQADVLLHAAVSEGFCNAVMEAQAMRVPVVCSDADGLSENVVDGVTGFVVPRRDARAMAQKLAQLAREPGRREAMGRAGRARVREQFAPEAQMEAFVRLYEGVMDRGRA